MFFSKRRSRFSRKGCEYNMKVIRVNNLWKKFSLNHRRGTLRELLPTLFRRSTCEEFWALKGVNFEVEQGEAIGIIGPNGSGKSTLLKIITGITSPTLGNITVLGRVCPLIELGAGFHPDLTGHDNVYLNGLILGLKKEEISQKFDDIVDFAELRDFINIPVKHYSLGMYMRLGFAIAVHVNADILAIDEVLAVGDERFRRKCLAKFDEFRAQGKTTIFVSHDYPTVRRLCDRIIYIESGEISLCGLSEDVFSKLDATLSQPPYLDLVGSSN